MSSCKSAWNRIRYMKRQKKVHECDAHIEHMLDIVNNTPLQMQPPVGLATKTSVAVIWYSNVIFRLTGVQPKMCMPWNV